MSAAQSPTRPFAWLHSRKHAKAVAIPLSKQRVEAWFNVVPTEMYAPIQNMALDLQLLPCAIRDPPLMRLLLYGCEDAACEQCASKRELDNTQSLVYCAPELFQLYMGIVYLKFHSLKAVKRRHLTKGIVVPHSPPMKMAMNMLYEYRNQRLKDVYAAQHRADQPSLLHFFDDTLRGYTLSDQAIGAELARGVLQLCSDDKLTRMTRDMVGLLELFAYRCILADAHVDDATCDQLCSLFPVIGDHQHISLDEAVRIDEAIKPNVQLWEAEMKSSLESIRSRTNGGYTKAHMHPLGDAVLVAYNECINKALAPDSTYRWSDVAPPPHLVLTYLERLVYASIRHHQLSTTPQQPQPAVAAVAAGDGVAALEQAIQTTTLDDADEDASRRVDDRLQVALPETGRCSPEDVSASTADLSADPSPQADPHSEPIFVLDDDHHDETAHHHRPDTQPRTLRPQLVSTMIPPHLIDGDADEEARAACAVADRSSDAATPLENGSRAY